MQYILRGLSYLLKAKGGQEAEGGFHAYYHARYEHAWSSRPDRPAIDGRWEVQVSSFIQMNRQLLVLTPVLRCFLRFHKQSARCLCECMNLRLFYDWCIP